MVIVPSRQQWCILFSRCPMGRMFSYKAGVDLTAASADIASPS